MAEDGGPRFGEAQESEGSVRARAASVDEMVDEAGKGVLPGERSPGDVVR